MKRKLFYIAILIVPFLSVPLLGKRTLKRFLPAAIFMCTFTKVIDQIGQKKKWWIFYKGIPPLNSMDFLNFGPFFVSSLWMLKMTYGKFPLYFLANLIYQICFIYLGGIKMVSRFRIFTLVRLTKLQYLGIDTIRALLLYAFQYIVDFASKERASANKANNKM